MPNTINENRNPTVRVIAKLTSLVLLAVGGFLLVIGIRLVIQNQNAPLLLPVHKEWLSSFTSAVPSTAMSLSPPSTQQTPKMIYGFLPYWTVKDLPQHSQLTHIGYFALPIDKNGKFITAECE